MGIVPIMSRLSRFIRRYELAMVAVVLLLSLLLRIAVALRNPIPAGDGVASNLEVARNLNSGLGFSTMRKWMLSDPSMEPLRPEGNRQPGMPTMIAVLFRAFGPTYGITQALALVLGMLCLLMGWLWARTLFGREAGLVTLVMLAVNPCFVWFSTQPDSLMLYVSLFLAVLLVARRELTLSRAALLGLLCGGSYLVRSQGSLLCLGILVWILVAANRRKILFAVAFCLTVLVVTFPWFVRNARDFGSPTYSQSTQLLINENHWAAWEVRDEPMGPTDMLEHQGPLAVARYLVAGALRVFEPMTVGTLHREKSFAQPALLCFALCALLALRDGRTRRKMLLPLVASIPSVLMLALHEHSGRYLAFAVVMVLALGAKGLLDLLRTLAPPKAVVWGVALLAAYPTVLPLMRLALKSDIERAREAREVASWISENTEPDEWVITFPNVELFVWKYRRPTLGMPNDYEMLLWPCIERHDVSYIVIDWTLPLVRPRLRNRWLYKADRSGWEIVNPPPFLEEVWRSSTGETIVYEFVGSVPEGFMEVDSLPRNNCRALPPSI
jgi:4-amino-4-deoxy-L-arabinose transferase-like glycosyltransferase